MYHSEGVGIDIGTRLKSLRAARRWSQADLAERASVARNTINRVENGLAEPSLGLLQRLADIFGVPLMVRVTPSRRRRHG